MSVVDNAGPYIIGGKPKLNEDQIAVVDLLKEALAAALEGKITSVGVITCMKNGYAHAMAGRQASDLNMGCDSMKLEILQRVEKAGAQRMRQ